MIVCSSIKVAEAAKVMENTQRDVNIALMNEFYSVLSALAIDTHEVIEAASTKWNFHPYTPGLVGGHCISVDPYYFAHKAGTAGVRTELLLAARDTNENLSSVIVDRIISELLTNQAVYNGPILIVGVTFKENCPDFRNTKVMDVYKKLTSYNIEVDLYDPIIHSEKFQEIYGISLLKHISKDYNLALYLVPHDVFDGSFWNSLIVNNGLKAVFDLKNKLGNLNETVKLIK